MPIGPIGHASDLQRRHVPNVETTSIAGIAADVADRLVEDVVRLYDYRGQHVRDLGGPGHGPGEFNDPRGLAVANDGTVYVFTGDLRVNVLSDTGETLPAGAAGRGSQPLGFSKSCR